MQNYVGREVASEFEEPEGHFVEGGERGYGVAEDTGVRAAVVEAGY